MKNNFWVYHFHHDNDNTITLDVVSRLTNTSERNNYSVIMFGEENPVPQAIVLTEYADVVAEALNEC